MVISIFSGFQQIETRECAAVLLPDGRPGAIWRGLAYPVAPPDGRIDIDGEAFPPDQCLNDQQSPEPPPKPFALVEGSEELYVLISGPIATCEGATVALKAAGHEIIRSGRYLGDAVNDISADWFIRISKPSGGTLEIANLLASTIGSTSLPTQNERQPAELRAQLLAVELTQAKAREAALREEIARLKLDKAVATEAQTEIELLRGIIQEEQGHRAEAEAAAITAQKALESRSAPRVIASPKIAPEVEAVFTALLPKTHLIRDSLLIVIGEFSNRRALYRGLAELQQAEGRVPPAWKKLQGSENWWERHISDGQDDSGRIYAKWNNADRNWDVLVSHKGQQSRDIIWLSRQ